MAEIQNTFGVTFPVASLFRAGTIADLAGEMMGQVRAINYSGLVPIHTQGRSPNIFFVHDISGQILSYYPLAKRLKDHHPVYAISSWPVDSEKDLIFTVSSMAASYVQEMRTVQPHGPYILIGHSAGATIALEMARQLEHDNELSCLMVFDADAPLSDAAFFQYPEDDADLLIYTMRTLEAYFGQDFPLDRSELEGLTLPQSFELILARIREERFPSFVASAQQMAEMFSIYKANIAALKSYRWTGLVKAPIYLWSTQDQPIAADEILDRHWNKVTSAELITFNAQGDHVTMLKEPNVAALSTQLLSVIAAYQNDHKL
jgi:thioesterase domain-containing protein